MFEKEPPIKFKFRPGNKLEESIHKHVKKLNITVPIIHVRAGMYLVGSARVNLEQKFNHVMVRVGGGTERFDNYIQKNHRKHERTLVQYMSISQGTLDHVVEKIMSGQKIRKPPQNKKEEGGEKGKRNRSGMAAVKRVHVKLRDDSSMSGSINSRQSLKSKGFGLDKDKKSDTSGYGSDKFSSGNNHFLNQSIVDSINKGKLARGFSPLRSRGGMGHEMKNSFGDGSTVEAISTNNTQYNKMVPHSAFVQKQGVPTVEDQESISKDSRYMVTNRFDIDESPRERFSPRPIVEPAKTTRVPMRQPIASFQREIRNMNNDLMGPGPPLSPTYKQLSQ